MSLSVSGSPVQAPGGNETRINLLILVLYKLFVCLFT